jgi:uncharacterized membrane protein YfcA
MLDRRKASAASMTYAVKPTISFWIPGMVASTGGIYTSTIGIIGGYVLMLLALIHSYYDPRKAKNAILRSNTD